MYPYIEIFGFYIPTYGLCICLAIFLCAILSFRKAKKISMDYNNLLIIFAVSIGFSMLVGSLLYILITYDFEILYKQIITGNILFFKNQGIVFYGGLIGGIFGAIITAKILKTKINDLELCVVPYIPLGHAIGRIGCLLAGCCYGFSYKGIFSVSTKLNLEHGTYFPIQVIEAIFNLLIMIILLFYIKRKRTKYSVTLLYLVMYSILRFLLEFFRGDIIRGSFLFFSTSQWISLIILLISLIFCLQNVKVRNFSDAASVI